MHIGKLSGFIAAALMAVSATAFADTLNVIDFTFTDPNAGSLVANATLTVDLTTGQALSGSGSIDSSLFVTPDNVPLGPQTMTLVTSSNRGQNNIDSLGGFLWTDSDGTNLQVDTAFSLTSPYVDSDGLLFAVGAPEANGHYASFNFYYNNNGDILGDFLGKGGNPPVQVWNVSSNGTLTINSVAAVPETGTWLMMLSGLCVFAGFAASRKTLMVSGRKVAMA